jgi:hypothetical protein
VTAEAIPALRDGFVEAFTGWEAVSRGLDTGDFGRRVHQAPQQVGRQQSAFGADGLKFSGAAGHLRGKAEG